MQLAKENISQLTADMSEVEGKYLTFWTDQQLFGIPIAEIEQIVQMQEITSIPEFPSYARGIIHLRGGIIPVIDMRLRLGKMPIEYNDHTCIIIITINEKMIGFIVDGVEEVTSIEDDDIAPPPQMSGAVSDEMLTGVSKLNDHIVLLIDTRKIAGEEGFPGF